MNVRKPNAGKLLKKLPLAEGCAHPVLPRYPVFRLGREALHQRRCHAGCTGRLVGLDVKSRPAALPENGLQRVRWWLEGDTLYRATSAASDRYPLPAPKKAVAVLSGISELQVRLGKPDCFGQVGNRSFAIAVLTEVLIGRRDDLVSDLMIGGATDAGGSY